MDPKFWETAWREGRTNFHLQEYNEALVEHFPKLNPQKGNRVLVPLCGKTKDLLWLQSLNLSVHGVELYRQAVEDFFRENRLPPPSIAQDQDFIHYKSGGIEVSCGDFLKLAGKGTYEFVYDRGALVALPASMREDYSKVIKRCLKKGGKYLLVVYNYDQSMLEGPPFSIDLDEVSRLYKDQFTITLVQSETPTTEGPRLAAFGDTLKREVYILEKTA